MSDTGPAIPDRVVPWRRLLQWWRGSLRARVITTTVGVGMAFAALLGSLLYQQVASGLVEQAVEGAQRDASQQVALAQEAFDSIDRRDDTGLRLAANEQLLSMAGNNAEDGRRVLLLPALSNDRGGIVEPMWVGVTSAEAPPGLQRAVDEDRENQQVVVTPVSFTGQDEPVASVVVASRVSLVRAGAYDLMLIYPMVREQETLHLVRQLFLAAGLGLGLLAAGLAVIATRMVTRPVSEVAGVSREVARGRLEQRLPVRGTDEIAQLATSFNTMADSIEHQIRELRSLSQLQQRFVSDVSHELRTPLTTMRMAGAVLHSSREDFPLPVARSAELLDQELDRFESLLTELLEISRFDSGAVTLERHDEDLVALVHVAVDGVRALAERLGTTVLVHAPDRAVLVSMDGRRVSRVLRNLLTNALEHCEGQPVEVTVAATDNVVSCSVRDHGIGLDHGQQAQVFDRFWRADPARARTTGGTGLGLAIALEDARVHGGVLQVGSSQGQGACFRLLLPRRAGLVIADEPPPVPMPHQVPAATGRGPALPPPLAGASAGPAAAVGARPAAGVSAGPAAGVAVAAPSPVAAAVPELPRPGEMSAGARMDAHVPTVVLALATREETS